MMVFDPLLVRLLIVLAGCRYAFAELGRDFDRVIGGWLCRV